MDLDQLGRWILELRLGKNPEPKDSSRRSCVHPKTRIGSILPPKIIGHVPADRSIAIDRFRGSDDDRSSTDLSAHQPTLPLLIRFTDQLTLGLHPTRSTTDALD